MDNAIEGAERAALAARVRAILDAGTSGRLLVIGGDERVRLEAADTVREAGYATDEAANPREALGKLRALSGFYTAVVVGADMPGSLIAEIRAMHRNLPVLAVRAGEAAYLKDACLGRLSLPLQAEAVRRELERLGVRCEGAT